MAAPETLQEAELVVAGAELDVVALEPGAAALAPAHAASSALQGQRDSAADVHAGHPSRPPSEVKLAAEWLVPPYARCGGRPETAPPWPTDCLTSPAAQAMIPKTCHHARRLTPSR